MGLLRTARQVAHPVRTMKRSVKHAIIPRRTRRNHSGIGCLVLLGLAAVGWGIALTVQFPAVMWPIWGVVAVLFVLYRVGRWRLRKQARGAQQVADRYLQDHFSPDGLSFKASDGQWYSTDGRRRWDGQAWQPHRPGPCSHCGAPDQMPGQPCRFCRKSA